MCFDLSMQSESMTYLWKSSTSVQEDRMTCQLSFQSMNISFNCPYNPVWQTSLVYLKFAIGTFCWSVNHCVIVLELGHFLQVQQYHSQGWCILGGAIFSHQHCTTSFLDCHCSTATRRVAKGWPEKDNWPVPIFTNEEHCLCKDC